MRVIQPKKQKTSLLLKIAVFAFSVYMIAALVNQQVQISEKSRQLEEIQEQLQVQEIRNEEIRRAISDNAVQTDEYIERYAREELDYAKPGERIFVNIAGN
ncbi:MAG TPA: septum formation initiator family protein [Candidatus Caccousia avistercoris]|nr:septum formation initiator family protein [Candidatus Caccousia avistercoris]